MRKNHHVAMSAIIAIVFALSTVVVVHAKDADVSGTWKMTVTLPGGTGNPSFKLQQKGSTVTGTYIGRFGESPVLRHRVQVFYFILHKMTLTYQYLNVSVACCFSTSINV